MSERTDQELLDMMDPAAVERADVVIGMRVKQKHPNTCEFMFNSMCKEDPAIEKDAYNSDIPEMIMNSSEIIMCIAKYIYSVFPKIDDFRSGFKKKFLESLQYVNDKDDKIAFYNKDGNIDKLTDAIIKDMHIENV